MRINSQKTTQLCKRLSACGVRQENVYDIINTIQKWEVNNGDQWTVSRLKDLKVSFIQLLASGKDVSDHKWPDWVKLNKISGFPSGTFGVVMQQAYSKGDSRRIQRAISVLMVYSASMSPTITEKQWFKFQKSAEKSVVENVKNLRWMSEETSFTGSRKFPLNYNFLEWGTANKSEPTTEGLISGRANTQKEDARELIFGFQFSKVQNYFKGQLSNLLNSDSILMKKPEISGPTMDMLTLMYLSTEGKSLLSTSMDVPVGKIGFIQEPGLKLRSVANPHRIYQLLLDPLKEDLLSILHKLDSDCTMDQQKGVEWAQAKLGECYSISSVDLSDATNNFPLDIQNYMLRSMYSEQMSPIVDLFTEVSRSPWLVKDPTTNSLREFKWSVGQPLGLGPSFPAFALAHHMIMWETIAQVQHGNMLKGRFDFFNYINEPKSHLAIAKNYTDEYRILGDDIVMKSYYEDKYIQNLKTIDIGVSKDKTITSNHWAEFASRLVSKDMNIVQNKWKQTSDRNFLDLARNLGPVSLGLLRPKQQKLVKALAQVPDIIETGYGFRGLGWNPKGLTMSLRYAAFKPFFDKTKKLDSTKVFKPKEVLAKEASIRLYGDEFVYNSNIFGISQEIANHRSNSGKGDSLSRNSIDKIFKIETHSLYESEIGPEYLEEPVPVRADGDPRDASVLDFFERRKLSDVLKTCNINLIKLHDYIHTNPCGNLMMDEIAATFNKGELNQTKMLEIMSIFDYGTEVEEHSLRDTILQASASYISPVENNSHNIHRNR